MNLRRMVRRSEENAELAREIEAHIAHEIDENLARGMSEEEARRRACLKFGSPRRVLEEAWRQNTIGFLDDLGRDLRYAARTLLRAPGFAFIAILVMALGIGSVTALFTVVRSVLLKPLPFREPQRLVMLYERMRDDKDSFNVVAPGVFGEWRKQAQSFEQMAVWHESGYSLSGRGGQLPEQIGVTRCSWNLFATLGVAPQYGRGFEATDDRPNAAATVVLSWSLWKRRFGGDTAIVGSDIFLNAKPYTVIGVMPEWFSYPDTLTHAWTPVYYELPAARMEVLDGHQFNVVARLKPGVTQAQALSEVDTIEHRIHDEYLDKVIGKGANIRWLLDAMVGDYRTPLYMLLAATGCVLLIACLNVANLLVARSAARRKEVAIRTALGGGRWRLLREQMTESVVLSFAGGMIGLLLAYLSVQWIGHARQDMARAGTIHIDGFALAFAAAVTLLAGALAGAMPALGSRHKQVLETLQESGRSHSAGQGRVRLRKILLSVEVGLTVVLLLVAGLLLKGYQRLRSVDLGCATQNVLTMHLGLPAARYSQPVQRAAFFEQLITDVRSLPGVEQAGLVTIVPGQGYGGDNWYSILEHPPLPQGQFEFAIMRAAEPRYFAAMQIPLLKGRTFTDAERLDRATAVIISDQLARKSFAGEDPIGKHMRFSFAEEKTYEVIGIVGDTRYQISEESGPMVYLPLYAGNEFKVVITARARRAAEGLALPIQKLVAQMDPDLPVFNVLTMEQAIGKSTTDATFNATLVLAFAVLSLLLAAVGLYGVLSYLVTQRTSEIGIRIALGAQRGTVLWQMLTDGLHPACLGLALGLVCGGLTARLISGLLYGVRPLDASVFAAVAALLLLVASAACALPAWQASRLDPMQALRAE